MSATKGALKAAKIAIDAQNYVEAEKKARSVLETDTKHYTAFVFLGLALERQGKIDESERVYNFARDLKPKELLALQGLLSVYELQAARKVDDYGITARQLAQIHADAEDLHKCQVVVDKYVAFAKQHGTRSQYKTALEFILPTSSIYDFLEGRLIHPSHTYPKVIEIIEAEESQRINKLIGERRTRIGARVGDITTEVRLEVFKSSNLEKLYQDVIDWTNEDDIRRLYEERLLQRAYDTLAVVPVEEKPGKRQQVQKLAEGMIILKHPFALAWNIVLEWTDHERIQDFDVTLLRTYIDLFPEDGLTKILNGYLDSEVSPFPKPPKQDVKKEENGIEDEDGIEIDFPQTSEDRMISMIEGLEQSARSITSQRFMGEYYLALEEYASVVTHAQKTLELLGSETFLCGPNLQNSVDGTNVILGTALVQYETPRHHSQARDLFEGIIKRKVNNTAALIGLGLILEEECEYKEAIKFFERVLQRSPDIRIKSEAAWCRGLMGDYATALRILQECLEDLRACKDINKELLSLVHYRIGDSMWNLDTSKPARKDRNGAYAHFITSLKANVNYAPPYTSLGFYYADYVKDKSRARKCFQKAFELSISEVDAAQRLARLFADQKDWELVEAVSQRVVGSGKVRPPPGSKKKGIGWPFAALGVCQLNNQEYAKSIVSFQAALRISPEDYHSWIGLGESYHSLGRYIAATKAFEHALNLQNDQGNDENLWFSRYMLANVKRELGYFEEAITSYDGVLEAKPDEVGVAIALIQTYLEYAWSCVSAGLFKRAVDNCGLAINIAHKLAKLKPQTFNLWKTLGDLCSIYSWAERYSDEFPAKTVVEILKLDSDEFTYQWLEEIDQISWDELSSLLLEGQETRSNSSMSAAIFCQKRAIHCAASDIHAQAVAWYNLGWVEYRASTTIAKSPKQVGQFLKAAVQSFKRAIELESGNAEFWDALGIVTTKLNPKVAQHAFVRSLYINDRSAKTWTNLGTLYLLQDDIQLANQAFTRGQSSDPEYAHAWLGQGILALIVGDLKEAQALFTHAFEIADATSLIVKRLYSSSSFDQLSSSKQYRDITELLQPLFALHQLRSQEEDDIVYQHLSVLLCERLGDHTESIEVLESLCSGLEEEYEESEKDIALEHFSQAKADLARAYLAAGNLDAAIENAETALNLSTDDEPDSSDSSLERLKYRLSALLTSGLAFSSKGDTDSAIKMFKDALVESSSDPHVVTLLSQVLWARGGQEEKRVARKQLSDCINKHPDSVEPVMLLGVIAILDHDNKTLTEVLRELQFLRTQDSVNEQQKLKIGRLLATAPRFLRVEGSEKALKESITDGAISAIMAEPSATHVWRQLAELGEDDRFPSEMALITAKVNIPPRGTLDPEDLADVLADTGIPANIQKGIILAPWLTGTWEALA